MNHTISNWNTQTILFANAQSCFCSHWIQYFDCFVRLLNNFSQFFPHGLLNSVFLSYYLFQFFLIKNQNINTLPWDDENVKNLFVCLSIVFLWENNEHSLVYTIFSNKFKKTNKIFFFSRLKWQIILTRGKDNEIDNIENKNSTDLNWRCKWLLFRRTFIIGISIGCRKNVRTNEYISYAGKIFDLNNYSRWMYVPN